MPQFFRLSHPGISSISHGGREYLVNEAGLLEVPDNEASHALTKHITSSGGRVHVDEQVEALNAKLSDEEAERQSLFSHLDIALGRRVDRRRSLAQLREMLDQHHRDQAKLEQPKTALTDQKGTEGAA
jgi:hypothetical protein